MNEQDRKVLTELSQQVYNISADFSAFKNEQDGVNEKLLGYLENNPKTDQKGYIAKVDKNTSDIKDMKDKWYKATTIVSVVSLILGYIGKKIWDMI